MSAINYLTLRSTLFYSAGSAGTLPPGSSIITTDPNGLQVATNNIKINTATYSTLLGSSISVSSITAPAILGTTTLGQNASYPNRYAELGTDQTNSMYLDFHSNDSALPDYSTRIQSLGGGTTGTGIMNLYASTIGLMGTAGVGIGKTNPAYALDVTGTVNISGSYYVNGAPMSSSQWTTSGSLIYYNGGNVGIGTNNPTQPLHVYTTTANAGIAFVNAYNSSTGSIGLYTTTAAGNFITNGTAHAGVILATDGKDLYLSRKTDLSCAFVVQGGTGNIGIGKTNPGYALDVAGTVNISGSYYVNGAPMSSSQWTTNASTIYYTGGNVGIGTTGPTNLLTVTQLGSSYTKPVLVLDAGIPANATAGAPRGIGSPLLGIGALSYTTGGVAGDYYGIGFGYGGHIAGNYYPAEIGFYVQNTGGAEWGDIVFSTRNVTTNTVVSERMRITGSGNVGIGTTSPSTVLHLYGSSTGYTNGIMTITNANTNPQACFNVLGPSMSTGNNMLFNIGQSLSGYNAFGLLFGYVGAGSTSNYFLLSAYGNGNGLTVQGSGNVGISTTNPTNPLHIYTGNACPFVMEQSSTTANYMTLKSNGTVYGFFGLETSTGGGLFGSNTGYGMSIGTPTATNFNIATNNTVRATVTSSGNVGIGMTAPGYLLTVGAAGNPSANNAGTTTIQTYGNINLARNRMIFSIAGNDWNHCIYNAYHNMDNEGVWDGMKFNVYNGAWFRVGQASGSVPTTALFINSTGSVGIGNTTPAATLDVNGAIVAGNNTGGLSIKNASGVVKNLMTLDTSNVLRIQGGGGVMYINNDNTGTGVSLNYASAAAFNVYNGTNLTMTCASTGTNVGIGTGSLTASTLTVYPSITVTGQSFVVGGSAGTFYPVLIDTTPSWTSTNIYKITISRSEVHLDSTWKGSMTFILEGHITAWGNGADYSRYKFVGSNTGTPTWTNFIANYIEDPTSRFVVVMLRGLTTYYFSGEGCTLNNGNGSGTSLTIPGGNNSVYTSTTTISPPFDGTYAFGDNRDNLFGKNGYVGIGTNNPNTLLHVNGSINCSGLVVNGTSVATGTGSVWSVSGSNIMYTSGNVGIGVASPANTLDIQGAVRSGTHATGRGLYVTMDNYDSSNGFEFRHSNGSQGIGIGYNSIYATGYNVNQDLNLFPRGTGKVGIFTTNPGATLHIYQNINGAVNQYIQNVSAGSSAFSQTWLANDSGSGGGMFLNSSTRSADGGVNTMTVRNDAGDLRLQAKGGTLGIHVLSTSGFVGIGITNPQAPLHVGTLASNGASGSSAINYGGIGPGYMTSWNGTAGVLNGGAAGSRAAGATGIFSMNDVVTGNNLIAMDFISFSDARIKKNISTFGRSALELIHKVRIVSYDHIDFKKSSCAAGIIAQEIEEVFPECIKHRKDVVPNIYRPAIHSRVDDHIRLQLVDENGLAISRANADVLNAKRVSLRIYRDNQEHHFDVNVYETNGSLFHVSSWSDYTETDEVFVFGTEVEDFRVIDKEMVAMVGIKAIQDVDTKVIALEQENAMLKSQLASLLQWAQQQGYKA